MDDKEVEPNEDKAAEAEKSEENDEDFNINEIVQLDEILGSNNAEKIKMLDYERQMFLDCVYNDGLVICGK